MTNRKDFDRKLAALSEHAASPRGRRFWRSLEELANSEAFQELMRQEFPLQAEVWPDALSRRKFLALMGASLALAGVSGCSVKPAPANKIVPYVRPPREIEAGKPLFFATTMPFAGEAVGLLVESHMGRPTKIEGNPDHPASLGGTSPFHQASILTLYDPDRSQIVTHLGRNRSWNDAFAALRTAILAARKKNGAGLRILSEPILSPTLAEQRRKLLEALPEAQWHTFHPIQNEAQRRGTELAFGKEFDLRYDFTKADVVVSLDSDFLSCGAGYLRYVRNFISRRRATDESQAKAMSRLYVAESSLTTTGAKADHRLALRPSQIETLARGLAARFGVSEGEMPEGLAGWIDAVADDLDQHHGRSLIVAGLYQPPAVHLLAQAMNDHLGNFGQTVFAIDPIADTSGPGSQSLRELTDEMSAGKVDALILLGGNPVYSAPVDLPFARAMEQVPFRLHLGLYQDETARLCHWHLPEAHYLESWGDARAYDGTASLIQPLIEPLYRGRSISEIVGYLVQLRETPGDLIVRDYWRRYWSEQRPTDRFAEFWETALHDGFLPETQFPEQEVSMQSDWQRHLESERPTAIETSELELAYRPDPTLYDGWFANNGWLQELPDPLTKLTWDNAAILSPATARELELDFGRYAHGGEHGGYHMPVVVLDLGNRSLRAAVWIAPGQPDGVITLSLGYGRWAAGRVGGAGEHLVGFNANLLRTSKNPWFESGIKIVKTGERHLMACTQQHHLMENREVIRAATVEQFQEHPEFANEWLREKLETETSRATEPLSFYNRWNYDPPLHKWGMAINLNACVGCNACVVACQAENNIPVVGKEQVAFGREMHWLRIDRYIAGPEDAPDEFYFQPLPCMHCENAPCEYVCPVEATVHSAEGLNDMVYNRCVGTRFCSNNCPYKVRRFNFLAYGDFDTPVRALQYNPDVTVRSRGVMEKCTYCVQRIRHAEIDAQKENRPIYDREVLTACQAACPAEAIAFGDINDSESEVARVKQSPLNYGLLADLNTLPRTTYVAALRNPNPRLEGA
jgi:molybdopterin-containing oxidoreductase family iron-sulfur binding subunit